MIKHTEPIVITQITPAVLRLVKAVRDAKNSVKQDAERKSS